MADLGSQDKPKSIEEYKRWMYSSEIFDFHDERAQENYYTTMSRCMKKMFEEGEFWTKFIRRLPDYEEEYKKRTNYDLLKKGFIPSVLIKPYNSFIDKCFRRNVSQNDNWPKPPTNGWITCRNAANIFSDIIRTNVVVQYLDGVDDIVKMISEMTPCDVDYQAKTEGYYAVHIDVKTQFEVPSLKWDTQQIDGKVEIQVTTELKELIKEMLHKSYEADRSAFSVMEVNKGWQWNYQSNRFRLNFLGHVVHSLEGNILDIRDRENMAE